MPSSVCLVLYEKIRITRAMKEVRGTKVSVSLSRLNCRPKKVLSVCTRIYGSNVHVGFERLKS